MNKSVGPAVSTLFLLHLELYDLCNQQQGLYSKYGNTTIRSKI